MLFKAPMAYDVTYVPKGKRNERKEQFWEYVEIDIPVLSDETAPVAVEWRDGWPVPEIARLHQRDDWAKTFPVPSDGRHVMRLRDGEYFLKSPTSTTPDDLARSLDPENNFLPFGLPFIHRDNRGAERPFSDAESRADRECASEFSNVLASLRERVSSYFIADGHLYERSSEPIVIAASYHAENDLVVTVPRITTLAKIDARRTPFFSIERYQEVLDSCNKPRRLGPAAPKISGEGAPRIHCHPERRLDARAERILFAAQGYVDDLHRIDNLRDVDPDYGIRVLGLRKALAEYEEDGDVAAVIDAAERLVGDRNGRHDYAVARIREALDDYARREIVVPGFGA